MKFVIFEMDSKTKKRFSEIEQGEKFITYEDNLMQMFIKCESGVTIDDGMTEVNAVNLTSGEFWTIGERVEVEV